MRRTYADYLRDTEDLATATAKLHLLSPTDWRDYELLDSGDGAKLERFGEYTLVRPERQAIWSRRLPADQWDKADAAFERTESGAEGWVCRRPVPERWPMHYRDLTFWARLTPFRHTGVFPEQAAHWTWMESLIRSFDQPVRVLDLFAYTGLGALAAAAAGASVTYVDASRPALTWARENQIASGLQDRPIRWILDDVLKFVRREVRRGSRYEAIVMDPPVFGRGPKGEIWRFHTAFPALLEEAVALLAPKPLFVLVNAYAIQESSLMLRNALTDRLPNGQVEAGELVLVESSGGRLLSTGIFGRWVANGRGRR